MFWEVWPEAADPVSPYWVEYHRCMEQRVPVQFDAYFEPLDIWTGVTAYPVSTGGIAVFFRDVSAVKRAEQAVREAEERFRVAVKNAAFVPAQTDRELRYRWIYNPHPDFDPSLVIGKRDDELEDSEGSRRLVQLKRRVLESGEGAREEIAFTRSDGIRYYDFTIEPARDVSGAVVGVTSAAFDVTERKRAELALREREAEAGARAAPLPGAGRRPPRKLAMGSRPRHRVVVRRAVPHLRRRPRHVRAVERRRARADPPGRPGSARAPRRDGALRRARRPVRVAHHPAGRRGAGRPRERVRGRARRRRKAHRGVRDDPRHRGPEARGGAAPAERAPAPVGREGR